MKLAIFRHLIRASTVLMAVPTLAFAEEGSGEAWGARDPAGCPSIVQTDPPSLTQAVELLRCAHEGARQASGELWLMENLEVQMGGPVPYVDMRRLYQLEGADVEAATYPLRGSFTWAVCISKHDAGIYGDPTRNCRESDVPRAEGVCWLTSFADWRCQITGPATQTREATAPPQ